MISIADITSLVKLKKEKEIYYEAVQAVNQPILITDSRGGIIKVNQAFEKLYGFQERELLGQNPDVLNPGRQFYFDLDYSEEQYDQLFNSLWKDIRDPEIGEWKGTVINKRKDGKLMWINLIINTIFDADMAIKSFIALPVDISRNIKESEVSKLGLYKSIADLAAVRDNETGNHMRRVGLFARLIAMELGKSKKFCTDMEIFAPLHDIGKVGISDSLLLAERKLTEAEFELMKNHTSIGYQILKGKADLKMASEICFCHHERFDGTGYPRGLQRYEIPLSARITALVDVYDALRSNRPYKDPWTHQKTINEIKAGSRTRFDPVLVKVFLNLEEKIHTIYKKMKD